MTFQFYSSWTLSQAVFGSLAVLAAAALAGKPEKHEQEKRRIEEIDFAKGIAILSVHVPGQAMVRSSSRNGDCWRPGMVHLGEISLHLAYGSTLEYGVIVDRMRISSFATPKRAVGFAERTYPPRQPPSRKSNRPFACGRTSTYGYESHKIFTGGLRIESTAS